MVSVSTAVILNTIKDNASSISRNLNHVNIVSTATLANLSHSITGPRSADKCTFSVPIVSANVGPEPVVFKVYRNSSGIIVTTGIGTFTTTVNVMTLCYGECILIGCAASAGVSCITLFGTGSSSYCNLIVVMTESRLNKLATYCTILCVGACCRIAGGMSDGINGSCLAVVAGIAIALLSSHGGTGGSCYLGPYGVGVTECLVENNLTYGTDLIVLTIRFCAGSMTLCCNRIICVSILTNGTSMSCVTVSGTGRICYNGVVVMTKLRICISSCVG